MKMITGGLFLLAIAGCAIDEPARNGMSTLVPGTRSLVAYATPDTRYCGGTAIGVRQTGAADDIEPELVAALTIESPHDLDFTANQRGSRERFDAWLRDAVAKAERASTIYTRRATTPTTPPAALAPALAREVQILRVLGDAVEHAELPLDARTGEHAAEKARAYCDTLAHVAVPLQQKADVAAAACRQHTTSEGWWSGVCAPR